ncbi:M16 family metallopeptidase [Acidobacteriota bacterium]
MKRILNISLTIFIAFFWVCLLIGQAQSFQSKKDQVKTCVLKNGLKFIVMERHHAPVVSFHVYADVGSANESYGITGISHLLEHMAFKGTKIIGTRNYLEEVKILEQMDSLYEEITREETRPFPDSQKIEEKKGRFEELRIKAKEYVVTDEFVDMMMKEGDQMLNAYTNNDATQYVDSFPSNKLEFWMAMTSDRFLNPVFREFYKERDVVIEERRLSIETRSLGRLVEDFIVAAFKAHPYRHGVIGFMSDLKRITRGDVENYFKKYCGPNNLTVAIVGDVLAEEVFEMAEIYFGRIQSGEKPEHVRTMEPEQWGERRIYVEMQAQPFLLMGFHRPEARHEDDPALEALANILGQGRSSRLNRVLVNQDKVSVECGVFNGFPGDKFPNLIAFYAVPAHNHSSAECLELIDLEIEKIKKESVTEDELAKFRRNSIKRSLDQMKSNENMAEQLAYADVVLGDWGLLFDRIKKIQDVTTEDIQRVANKYLVKKNRTIGEIIPEEKQKGAGE